MLVDTNHPFFAPVPKAVTEDLRDFLISACNIYSSSSSGYYYSSSTSSRSVIKFTYSCIHVNVDKAKVQYSNTVQSLTLFAILLNRELPSTGAGASLGSTTGSGSGTGSGRGSGTGGSGSGSITGTGAGNTGTTGSGVTGLGGSISASLAALYTV